MKIMSLKRLVSGLLAALMVLTLLPTSAWAATTVASGSCGDNLTWTLDSEGTLTISGTGEMEDWVWIIPWYDNQDDIQKVVIQQGVTSIGDYAFRDCSSLTSVTIPDSVTSIGDGAFFFCSSLTSITIPNSVTSIGSTAFAYCTSLTSVSIPVSVVSIGYDAFGECSRLKTIRVAAGNTFYASDSSGVLFDKTKFRLICCPGGFSGSYTIPNSVTTVNGSAFRGCRNLTGVSIPEGVTRILADTFARCYSLSSISIPDSVTSIGDEAFYFCSSLTSVSIGNGVTSIGDYAFYDCDSLTSVSIPNSVTSIGAAAFRDCTSLSSVSIGNSVTSIGSCAFDGCDSLTSVSIPNSVTSIGSYAFYSCDSLTSVSIGNGVTSIGNFAFYDCDSLTDVYYAGSKTQWNAIDIENNNNWSLFNATIHYNCMATPAAPKVSSSIVTSTGRIKLTWSAVDGAEKYYIYRSTDGGSTYKYYDSTTKTSYTNTSVTPGTKYYYKIKSVASGATSAYSNAVYRTADCAKPSLSSSIVTSSGAIKLSWDKVTGAAKYYIYRSTDGGKTYKYYTSTTSTSWTNKSVTPGTKYYYKIKAICSNTEGNSAYSNVVYRTADCAKPSLSSSIVSSSGAIKLSWDKVTGATKYYIYRSTDGGKTYSYYTSTTSTSWTNKSVTPGKTYYYKIKAICSNTEGNSAYSNVVSRTADCAKPVVTIQLNGGKPQLKWKAIDGAKEYVIYRATSKSGTYTKMLTTTKLSYTNTGAKAGTTYYYKVKAICAKSSYGNSAYSSVVSIKSK